LKLGLQKQAWAFGCDLKGGLAHLNESLLITLFTAIRDDVFPNDFTDVGLSWILFEN